MMDSEKTDEQGEQGPARMSQHATKTKYLESLLNESKRSDLELLTVPKLKELAEARGIKQVGIGWPKCCPPEGTKKDIITALMGPDQVLPQLQGLTGKVQQLSTEMARLDDKVNKMTKLLELIHEKVSTNEPGSSGRNTEEETCQTRHGT